MTVSSYTQKLISIDVSLTPPPTPGANPPLAIAFGVPGTTLTLSGSRASVRIVNSGALVGSRATVKVWGLIPSLMNQLSTIGQGFNYLTANTVTIRAGDNLAPVLPSIFQGTVYFAYAEYERQPDVPFVFDLFSGGGQSVAPANDTSTTIPTSVATIIGQLASRMGFNFENSTNITTPLPPVRLSGSLMKQARQAAQHAGCSLGLIGGTTIAIWPKGGSRQTTTPVVIAPPPQGQMIKYPGYTYAGIIVKTLFDPNIQFGSLVNVKSSIPNANGLWTVNKLDLDLDSLVPNGQWMATCYCYNPARPPQIPPGMI